MVCWKCKSEMPEGLKYCGNCGVHMNRAVWFVQWLFSKKGLPVLIGVLVLVIVGAGVLLWQGSGGSEIGALTAALDLSLQIPESETDPEAEPEPDFLTELERRNGYEVLSWEKTDTGAVAVVCVYAPDVYGVAKKLDADTSITDKETLLKVIAEEVKNAQMIEAEVEIQFTLTPEGYQPILTEEFMDAYYGGVIRLYEDMIAEAIKRAEGNQ